MTLEERLKQEVDEYEQYIQQVNAEIAYRRGRIAVLRELIEKAEEVKDEPTN